MFTERGLSSFSMHLLALWSGFRVEYSDCLIHLWAFRSMLCLDLTFMMIQKYIHMMPNATQEEITARGPLL